MPNSEDGVLDVCPTAEETIESLDKALIVPEKALQLDEPIKENSLEDVALEVCPSPKETLEILEQPLKALKMDKFDDEKTTHSLTLESTDESMKVPEEECNEVSIDKEIEQNSAEEAFDIFDQALKAPEEIDESNEEAIESEALIEDNFESFEETLKAQQDSEESEEDEDEAEKEEGEEEKARSAGVASEDICVSTEETSENLKNINVAASLVENNLESFDENLKAQKGIDEEEESVVVASDILENVNDAASLIENSLERFDETLKAQKGIEKEEESVGVASAEICAPTEDPNVILEQALNVEQKELVIQEKVKISSQNEPAVEETVQKSAKEALEISDVASKVLPAESHILSDEENTAETVQSKSKSEEVMPAEKVDEEECSIELSSSDEETEECNNSSAKKPKLAALDVVDLTSDEENTTTTALINTQPNYEDVSSDEEAPLTPDSPIDETNTAVIPTFDLNTSNELSDNDDEVSTHKEAPLTPLSPDLVDQIPSIDYTPLIPTIDLNTSNELSDNDNDDEDVTFISTNQRLPTLTKHIPFNELPVIDHDSSRIESPTHTIAKQPPPPLSMYGLSNLPPLLRMPTAPLNSHTPDPVYSPISLPDSPQPATEEAIDLRIGAANNQQATQQTASIRVATNLSTNTVPAAVSNPWIDALHGMNASTQPAPLNLAQHMRNPDTFEHPPCNLYDTVFTREEHSYEDSYESAPELSQIPDEEDIIQERERLQHMARTPPEWIQLEEFEDNIEQRASMPAQSGFYKFGNQYLPTLQPMPATYQQEQEQFIKNSLNIHIENEPESPLPAYEDISLPEPEFMPETRNFYAESESNNSQQDQQEEHYQQQYEFYRNQQQEQQQQQQQEQQEPNWENQQNSPLFKIYCKLLQYIFLEDHEPIGFTCHISELRDLRKKVRDKMQEKGIDLFTALREQFGFSRFYKQMEYFFKTSAIMFLQQAFLAFLQSETNSKTVATVEQCSFEQYAGQSYIVTEPDAGGTAPSAPTEEEPPITLPRFVVINEDEAEHEKSTSTSTSTSTSKAKSEEEIVKVDKPDALLQCKNFCIKLKRCEAMRRSPVKKIDVVAKRMNLVEKYKAMRLKSSSKFNRLKNQQRSRRASPVQIMTKELKTQATQVEFPEEETTPQARVTEEKPRERKEKIEILKVEILATNRPVASTVPPPKAEICEEQKRQEEKDILLAAPEEIVNDDKLSDDVKKTISLLLSTDDYEVEDDEFDLDMALLEQEDLKEDLDIVPSSLIFDECFETVTKVKRQDESAEMQEYMEYVERLIDESEDSDEEDIIEDAKRLDSEDSEIKTSSLGPFENFVKKANFVASTSKPLPARARKRFIWSTASYSDSEKSAPRRKEGKKGFTLITDGTDSEISEDDDDGDDDDYSESSIQAPHDYSIIGATDHAYDDDDDSESTIRAPKDYSIIGDDTSSTDSYADSVKPLTRRTEGVKGFTLITDGTDSEATSESTFEEEQRNSPQMIQDEFVSEVEVSASVRDDEEDENAAHTSTSEDAASDVCETTENMQHLESPTMKKIHCIRRMLKSANSKVPGYRARLEKALSDANTYHDVELDHNYPRRVFNEADYSFDENLETQLPLELSEKPAEKTADLKRKNETDDETKSTPESSSKLPKTDSAKEPQTNTENAQKTAPKAEQKQTTTGGATKEEILKAIKQKPGAHIVVNLGKPNERKIPVVTLPKGSGLLPGAVSVISYGPDGLELEQQPQSLAQALDLDDEDVKDVKLVKHNINAPDAEEESSDEEPEVELPKDTQPKKVGTAPLVENPTGVGASFLEAMYKRKMEELEELKKSLELSKIFAANKEAQKQGKPIQRANIFSREVPTSDIQQGYMAYERSLKEQSNPKPKEVPSETAQVERKRPIEEPEITVVPTKCAKVDYSTMDEPSCAPPTPTKEQDEYETMEDYLAHDARIFFERIFKSRKERMSASKNKTAESEVQPKIIEAQIPTPPTEEQLLQHALNDLLDEDGTVEASNVKIDERRLKLVQKYKSARVDASKLKIYKFHQFHRKSIALQRKLPHQEQLEDEREVPQSVFYGFLQNSSNAAQLPAPANKENDPTLQQLREKPSTSSMAHALMEQKAPNASTSTQNRNRKVNMVSIILGDERILVDAKHILEAEAARNGKALLLQHEGGIVCIPEGEHLQIVRHAQLLEKMSKLNEIIDEVHKTPPQKKPALNRKELRKKELERQRNEKLIVELAKMREKDEQKRTEAQRKKEEKLRLEQARQEAKKQKAEARRLLEEQKRVKRLMKTPKGANADEMREINKRTTQDSGRSLRALKRLLIAYKKKLDRKNTRKHIEPEAYESYDEDRPETPIQIAEPLNAPMIDLTKSTRSKKKRDTQAEIAMPQPGLLYETVIDSSNSKNIENLTTDEFVEKMQEVLLNEDQPEVQLADNQSTEIDVKPILVDYCMQTPTAAMLKQLESPAYLPFYKVKNPPHYKLYKNIYVRKFPHVNALSKKNCFKGFKVVDVKYQKYLTNCAVPLMDSVKDALSATKNYFADKLEPQTMLEIQQTYQQDNEDIDNQVFFAMRELQKPVIVEKRVEHIIAEIEISDEEIEETASVVKRKRGRPRKTPSQTDSNFSKDNCSVTTKSTNTSEDLNSTNYSNESSNCDSTVNDALPEEVDFVDQLELASTPYSRGRGRGRTLSRGAASRGRGGRGRFGRGSSTGGSEPDNATASDSSEDEDSSSGISRGRGGRGRGGRGRGRGRGRGKGRGGLNFFQREILTIQEKFKQEQGNPRKHKFKFPMPLQRPDSDLEEQAEHHDNLSGSDDNDEIFTYGHKGLHIKPSALLLYHPDIPTIRVYDSDEEIDPDERPSSALSFQSNSSNEAVNASRSDSYYGQSIESENKNDTEDSSESEDGDDYSDSESSEESNAEDYNQEEMEEVFMDFNCNSDLNTDEDSDDSDDGREGIAAFYRRLANDDGSATQLQPPPSPKRHINETYRRLLARQTEEAAAAAAAAERAKQQPAKEKIEILENILLNPHVASEDDVATTSVGGEEKVINQTKPKMNDELQLNEEIVKKANIPLKKLTIQIEPLPITALPTTTTTNTIVKSKLKRPSIASKETHTKEKRVKFADEITTTTTTSTTATTTTTTESATFLVPKAPAPIREIKKLSRL